jgi:quinol monooxygenase YgiN
MSEEFPVVSLHVKFYIDPTKVDEFLDALKPAYDAVIAEPECKSFEIYTLPEEPGVIKFVENWQAKEDWQATVKWLLEVGIHLHL